MVLALVLALVASPVSVHVRVDGNGFLRFARNAQVLYSSDVNLVAQDGILETSDGAILIPRIHVPVNCFKIAVSLDGRVTATTPSGAAEVGQFVLAMLPESAGQAGLFKSSIHSALSSPGDGIAGVIRTNSFSKPTGAPGAATQEAVVSPIKIAVRQLSEIDSDNMTLGDIAVFSGDRDRRADAQVIDLGRTPALGQSIRFSEGYLVTKLKLAGFKSADYTLIVPEGATVTRPSQLVPGARIVEAALNAIKERFDVSAELKPDAEVQDLKIPKGDFTLSAEVGSRTDRSITILVSAEVDGKRSGSRTVTMVPVGDQVGVKIGDQVTLRVIDAGAVVELNGTVKSMGWVGQKVSVLADTGSILTGTVMSGSLVEVRL